MQTTMSMKAVLSRRTVFAVMKTPDGDSPLVQSNDLGTLPSRVPISQIGPGGMDRVFGPEATVSFISSSDELHEASPLDLTGLHLLTDLPRACS